MTSFVAGHKLYTDTFFSDLTRSSLQSAEVVVPLIINLVHPKKVVDIGCGTGAWLSVFKKQGVASVQGVDGDYVDRNQLLIDENEFHPINLNHPFRLEDTFDLAICLEVAEHLPPHCSQSLIESLTKLAPFVLFSAALPGQGGIHHLNLQWPDYWEQHFGAAGFIALDPIRPLIWQDNRVAWWYRQNCYLFVKASLVDSDTSYQNLAEIKNRNQLTLIHEDVLAANLSFSSSLRRLPGLLIAFLFKNIRPWRCSTKEPPSS